MNVYHNSQIESSRCKGGRFTLQKYQLTRKENSDIYRIHFNYK